VQADEQVTLVGAEAPAVEQPDERIGRAGHHDLDAARPQLVAKQERHLQRNVLLVDAPGEVHARVPRIGPAMTGIHGDHMAREQAVRQSRRRPRGRFRGGGHRGRRQGRPDLLQAAARRVPLIPLAQHLRKDLRDELKREEQRVADLEGPSRERPQSLVEDKQGSAQQEPERLAGESHLDPGLIGLDPAVEGTHQPVARDGRAGSRIEGDRKTRNSARGCHGDHGRGRGRLGPLRAAGPNHQQRGPHRGDEAGAQSNHTRPRCDSARATSRSASRFLRSSRRSWYFLPRPRASLTFATPLRKYSSRGIRVRPFCSTAPMRR